MQELARKLLQKAGIEQGMTFYGKFIRWLPDDEQVVEWPSLMDSMPELLRQTGKVYAAERDSEALLLMVFNPFPTAVVRDARCWLWLRGLMEQWPSGQMEVSGELRQVEELEEALAKMASMSDWWNEASAIPSPVARKHRRQMQISLKKGQFNYLPGYVSRMTNMTPVTVGEAWSFVPLVIEAVWAQYPQTSLELLLSGLDARELGIHPDEALVHWASALAQTLREKSSQAAPPPIDRVIESIHKDCSLPYSQANLAKSLGLTPAYFCRLFREKTGCHFSQFLTRVRLEKAKDLLAEPGEMNLGLTAQQCGYPHKSYFCQVFKKYTGMSPGEYHQACQEQAAAEEKA